MKKLIVLLSSIGLTASTASAVAACKPKTTKKRSDIEVAYDVKTIISELKNEDLKVEPTDNSEAKAKDAVMAKINTKVKDTINKRLSLEYTWFDFKSATSTSPGSIKVSVMITKDKKEIWTSSVKEFSLKHVASTTEKTNNQEKPSGEDKTGKEETPFGGDKSGKEGKPSDPPAKDPATPPSDPPQQPTPPAKDLDLEALKKLHAALNAQSYVVKLAKQGSEEVKLVIEPKELAADNEILKELEKIKDFKKLAQGVEISVQRQVEIAKDEEKDVVLKLVKGEKDILVTIKVKVKELVENPTK